jgi:RNA polymerase sigma-70 factor (ECF subfamily)
VIDMTAHVFESDSGAAEALREAFLVHHRSLLGYVTRLAAGDQHRAEDVIQETMLRAWRHPEVLARGAASLRPWLFAVARRIVIDGWRAKSARPAEVFDEVPESAPVVPDEIEDLLDRLAMAGALSGLSPAHRSALVEIYYRQRSMAEIANALGIPAGTIKSRVFYALKALRAALQEHQSDAGGAARTE